MMDMQKQAGTAATMKRLASPGAARGWGRG